MKHLNITVHGKVQGVFYRHTAREKAGLLGLNGFIKNGEDSASVYLEVEGEEKSIEEFLNWCKTGPQLAQVENIESQEASPKNFTDFEIKAS